MEPWEALDVDDSDLHSLLRPCKRLNHNCNLYTSTSNSPPLLPPSSQSSESSQLQTSQHQLQSPPQCLIPGPAGSVQAAMVQRTYDRQSHSLMTSQGDNLIPTQEYIGRAVENSSDFDYDFQSKLWRYANDVFGKENGIPSTPLSSVNKCQKASRVDRVVAVVKSCTHNGLGGLMVTLKDRTGSIGASIHHKVLSENQYGKDICIGSVLILQKVAVFCPSTSSSSYYLNITLRNLIKVFCKESGPPSMHSLAAYEVNHSDPEIAASASARKASALQKISIPDKETTEEIIDVRTTEYMSAGGNLHKEVQMRKENLVPSSYICNKIRASNVTSIVDKECHNQLQSAAKGFEGTDRNRGTLHENNNQQMGENFPGSFSSGNKRGGSTKNHFDPEIQIADEVKDYKQPIVSNVSQLQWTDEQLDELFACEDDECSLL